MNSNRDARADGGVDAGFDDEELYAVVRTAVQDALLDVLGTVALLVIAFVVVLTGASAVASSSSTPSAAFGLAVVAVGVALAAWRFDLVPAGRD